MSIDESFEDPNPNEQSVGVTYLASADTDPNDVTPAVPEAHEDASSHVVESTLAPTVMFPVAAELGDVALDARNAITTATSPDAHLNVATLTMAFNDADICGRHRCDVTLA